MTNFVRSLCIIGSLSSLPSFSQKAYFQDLPDEGDSHLLPPEMTPLLTPQGSRLIVPDNVFGFLTGGAYSITPTHLQYLDKNWINQTAHPIRLLGTLGQLQIIYNLLSNPEMSSIIGKEGAEWSKHEMREYVFTSLTETIKGLPDYSEDLLRIFKLDQVNELIDIEWDMLPKSEDSAYEDWVMIQSEKDIISPPIDEQRIKDLATAILNVLKEKIKSLEQSSDLT